MDDKNFKKLLDDSLKPIWIEINQVKKTQERFANSLKKVQDVQENQLVPAVASIENTVKVYGDMYKSNNDNMKKLEKRTEKLEEKAKTEPQPELILAGV